MTSTSLMMTHLELVLWVSPELSETIRTICAVCALSFFFKVGENLVIKDVFVFVCLMMVGLFCR